VSDDTLCYIHLYRDKAGGLESPCYTDLREALEAAAEEWPEARYVGTVVLPREGQPTFEDWTEIAQKHREGATQDWLDQQREARAYRQKVL